MKRTLYHTIVRVNFTFGQIGILMCTDVGEGIELAITLRDCNFDAAHVKGLYSAFRDLIY